LGRFLKEYSLKTILKASGCGSCYPICTLIVHSTTIVFDIRIMHNVKIHTCPIYVIHNCDFITIEKDKVGILDKKLNS
jgi:hypothetical protein